MTDLDTLPARALVEVNRARAALGMPALEDLPKGKREDSCNCPVARALGAFVCAFGRGAFVSYDDDLGAPDHTREDLVEQAWDSGRHHIDGVRTPSAVAEFVLAFDDGALPSYEEGSGS